MIRTSLLHRFTIIGQLSNSRVVESEGPVRLIRMLAIRHESKVVRPNCHLLNASALSPSYLNWYTIISLVFQVVVFRKLIPVFSIHSLPPLSDTYMRIYAGEVKVKCTLVQALRLCTGRPAYRGSRGIALLYRHWGSVQAVRSIGGVEV